MNRKRNSLEQKDFTANMLGSNVQRYIRNGHPFKIQYNSLSPRVTERLRLRRRWQRWWRWIKCLLKSRTRPSCFADISTYRSSFGSLGRSAFPNKRVISRRGAAYLAAKWKTRQVPYLSSAQFSSIRFGSVQFSSVQGCAGMATVVASLRCSLWVNESEPGHSLLKLFAHRCELKKKTSLRSIFHPPYTRDTHRVSLANTCMWSSISRRLHEVNVRQMNPSIL